MSNVLIILIDDLMDITAREEFGVDPTEFPTFERLKRDSIHYTNAMVTVAHCGASRASMLTGRYNHNLRTDTSNSGYFLHVGNDQEAGTVLDAGTVYTHMGATHTNYGMSKVFHYKPTNEAQFDAYTFHPTHESDAGNDAIMVSGRTTTDLTDYNAKETALGLLDSLQNAPDPWSITVGFRRPHTKYFYDDIPSTQVDNMAYHTQLSNLTRPVNQEPATYTQTCAAFTGQTQYTFGTNEFLTAMREGYMRCVKTVDNYVGEILDRLVTNGMYNDTTIMLVSDHGFNIGENGRFCKKTLYDDTLKVPLFIKPPGMTTGYVDDTVFPVVDAMRVLTEHAGFDTPFQSDYSRTTGVAISFLPVCLDQATGENTGCEITDYPNYDAIGVTVRTDTQRYVRVLPYSSTAGILWESAPIAEELYDVIQDPFQSNNVITQRAQDVPALLRLMYTEAKTCESYTEQSACDSVPGCSFADNNLCALTPTDSPTNSPTGSPTGSPTPSPTPFTRPGETSGSTSSLEEIVNSADLDTSFWIGIACFVLALLLTCWKPKK